MIVNTTGPWAASLLSELPLGTQGLPPQRLSRAMNVVTPKLVDSHACGGLVGDRYLFMVPWGKVSMVGTSHDAFHGSPDQFEGHALGSRGLPERRAGCVSTRR